MTTNDKALLKSAISHALATGPVGLSIMDIEAMAGRVSLTTQMGLVSMGLFVFAKLCADWGLLTIDEAQEAWGSAATPEGMAGLVHRQEADDIARTAMVNALADCRSRDVVTCDAKFEVIREEAEHIQKGFDGIGGAENYKKLVDLARALDARVQNEDGGEAKGLNKGESDGKRKGEGRSG